MTIVRWPITVTAKQKSHSTTNSRQNKINSRQNKMYGGPQLSRHYKLHSRQNEISSWQYKVTHGNIKLTRGKTKFTHGKTKKTIWSAIVICISNGTSCNSKQTKWRPLSLRTQLVSSTNYAKNSIRVNKKPMIILKQFIFIRFSFNQRRQRLAGVRGFTMK